MSTKGVITQIGFQIIALILNRNFECDVSIIQHDANRN